MCCCRFAPAVPCLISPEHITTKHCSAKSLFRRRRLYQNHGVGLQVEGGRGSKSILEDACKSRGWNWGGGVKALCAAMSKARRARRYEQYIRCRRRAKRVQPPPSPSPPSRLLLLALAHLLRDCASSENVDVESNRRWSRKWAEYSRIVFMGLVRRSH